MMGQPTRINHESFIKAVTSLFPEVVASIDEFEDGLLHLEVAAFRQCVENAIDNGRMWDVERYCRFIADQYANADDALENAIGISFIEDFALGEITDLGREAVRERMPKILRDEIIAINDCWR